MDIGRDNGGVVDRVYEDQKPFPFTGTIKRVVFDITPHVTEEDEPRTCTPRITMVWPRTRCRNDQDPI